MTERSPRDTTLVAVVAIAVGLAAADSSIVVLALPDVYRDFDVSIVAVSQTITAYNVAIVFGALAVIPLESRVRGHILAGTGLAVFAVASLGCGVAGSFTVLIVARMIQGFGAAFALAGAVPVLAGIRRSDEHAIATWALAGTIGAAIGPALGGVLTELFSWRSIFLFQAPVAALALIPAVDRRARAVELPPTRDRPEGNGLANVGFLLLYGALVGALFLAVLLLVVVWGWSPITGALVVSAIPLGAIVVRKLGPLLPARFAVVTGGVALAGGLLGLAYLPAASAGWAAPALFACGLGLGLLSGILSPVSVSPSVPDVGAATISIAARHAGFVIALAVIAPVLSSALDTAALDATRATTAEILDSSIGYRAKIDLAFDLRDLVADTPRGEVPDASDAFAGADDDADLAATRDGVVSAVQDTVTRAFRSSFLIGAAFGAAAAIVALCLPGLRSVARHPDAITLASVVMVLVVALIAAEFRAGARDYGTREYVAPCDAPADPFPQGDGLDGTIQRIALSTINGAACELGTSREELLLSMEPKSGFGPEVTWTEDTLEAAVRAGLVRAVEDADERDTIPGLVARALRFAAERAPLDWVLGRFDLPFVDDA
jgi:MFS family permease